MRSEAEVLESINSLRSQLGMEPQSEPVAPTAQSTEDVQARIDALNQKLATTPMSRREFLEKRIADDQMSLSQKAYQFGSGAMEGFSMLYDQGKDAVKEFYQAVTEDSFTKAGHDKSISTLGAIVDVGSRDFYRMFKTILGSVGDELGGYTEEEEVEREYQRYLDNFNYHNVVREQMLEDVEYRKIADFGANFVDPFMIFPVAKLGSIGLRGITKGVQKGATKVAYSARNTSAVNLAKFAKGTAKVSGKVDKVVDVVGKIGAYPTELASRITGYGLRKGIKGASAVAGLGLKGVGKVGAGLEFATSMPRKAVAKIAEKVTPGGGGVALGGQLVGAFTGTIPGALELGIAEGLGAIAKKLGSKSGAVLSVLGQKSGSKRFLHRLATSDKVSEATRKRAMWAYTHYGTSLGDAMFNIMANSLTLGGINAGLAGLSGEDARGTGAAFGSGALAGMIPVGQEKMKAGKTDFQREDVSIDQYMKQKLAMDQRKEFSKLPRHTQVLIATLQESGIGAPEVLMVEPKAYLEKLNQERAKINEERIKNNQQPLPMFDRAPSGHYEPSSGTIYMNADKLKDASLVGIESMTHEIGHDYMHKALGQDPAMLELILERYKTTKDDPNGTAFYMMTDKDGKGIGEPTYLNQEATQFRTDYDRVQKGIAIGNDAKLLAQEIGAEQFAMHFVEEPNVLKQIHPRIRRHALDASRNLLSKIGVLDASTGNPLFNPISKEMRKNPAIERIYKNYGAMRAFELDEKANLAKDGILIEPKQGQTGDSRYTQLFGGIGLRLKDAKNLVVTNKGLIRELLNIQKRWEEEPSDGWSVKRGKLLGKKLTQDLREIFTRNDQFGNVANIIDALQQAIDERIGIRFGYRSGTKGKYQNPFRLRDVAIYSWEVSGMKSKDGRATLKVLGYNQAVVRQNIEMLVEKGYIQNPDQFMLDLAEQGQKALQDPEGRINPEGRGENELMTVAFGLKESANQVRSEGLRDLLESKAVKKSFVSFDVEALAGLTKGESKAFAFDYYNIQNNYNPFRGSGEKLFMPNSLNQPFNYGLPPLPHQVDLASYEMRQHLGLQNNILRNVLPSINQEKFSKEQFISALNKTAGAKAQADEIGLTNFMEDKKSLTKSEIERFVKMHSPEIEQNILQGTPIDELRDDYLQRELEYAEEYGYEIEYDDDMELYYLHLHGERMDDYSYDTETEARNSLEELITDGVNQMGDEEIREYMGEGDNEGEAQYGTYTEPGGDNYQERLITLTADESIFSDPHFDGQENTLLHIRSKERLDNKDNKLLFIEELQSDWHQKGRSEGYDNPPVKGVVRQLDPEHYNNRYTIDWEDGRQTFEVAFTNLERAQAWADGYGGKHMAGGVPDAPFKKNWPAVGLKIAIMDALNRGMDRVAWLGGQGQVDRYPSMVRQIDDVFVIYASDNRKVFDLEANMKNGGKIKKIQLLERDLVRYIGKKLAIRAVGDLANQQDTQLAKAEYKGVDIEIGADGMKNFYDKELVSLANKISKKIGGGKVEKFSTNRYGKFIEGWAFDLPKDPKDHDKLSLYMPDRGDISDASIPKVVSEGIKMRSTPVIEQGRDNPNLQKAGDTRYVNEGEVQREKRESVHSKGGVGTTRPKKVSYANRSELDLLRRLDRATPTDIGKAFSKKDKISSIFPKKVEAPYNKPVSLVGKIINDQADLAPLLTAFRHPYQEFLGCCIVDKAGKIKSANIIASGTIVASMVPYQVILREAFKVPDSKIFIWHNHPGGNPKPSAGDLGVTQTLVSNLKDVKNTKFGGHIVTNGDKYGFIDVAGDITINNLPEKDLAIWERVPRNELYDFSDANVGAQIAANLRQSDPKEYVHGIFVNRRNRVVGIQRVPFKMRNQHLNDLAEGALESGATAVVIADYDDSANTNALLNKHSMLKGFFAERGLELMDLFEPKVGSFEKTGKATMPERVMFRPAGDTPTLPQQFQPRQNSMMPATARAVATSASTLDRFRN